jgi:hypothetical protein
MDLNKEEKLKYELKSVLEKRYSGASSISIENITLESGTNHGDCFSFNLKIDTRFSDYLDFLNLSNMLIKHSTIKQLKKEQERQGYKDLMTLIADILEKHYES